MFIRFCVSLLAIFIVFSFVQVAHSAPHTLYTYYLSAPMVVNDVLVTSSSEFEEQLISRPSTVDIEVRNTDSSKRSAESDMRFAGYQPIRSKVNGKMIVITFLSNFENWARSQRNLGISLHRTSMQNQDIYRQYECGTPVQLYN